MTMRRSYWCLGLLALVLLSLQQTTQLVIAASESLPHRVYLVLKGSSWSVGDIVTIKGHPLSDSRVPSLTKRVRGVTGDRIWEINENLYINNVKIGRLQRHSSTGRAMHAIPSGIIPQGCVFVAGDHPKSFDSRYQSFGLVKTDHIVGRAIPLW